MTQIMSLVENINCQKVADRLANNLEEINLKAIKWCHHKVLSVRVVLERLCRLSPLHCK